MPDTHVAPMLEKHTIGFVPESDRHGKVRDLFTLWFGGNLAPLPIVTGALGPSLFGIIVQIPFLATSLYTGPVSAFLGGADLSWVAGLVVTGPIYLLLARRGSTGAKSTSAASSEPAPL
jgi:purine-cytosine permease-like protein